MKTLLSTIVLMVFVGTAFAQLIVNSEVDPQVAVQNHFLTNGVFVSNATFNGVNAPGNNQLGTFDASNSNLGLPSGITMATGNVAVAIGPNDSGSATMQTNAPVDTDSDLFQLDPNVLNDEAILEFDFIATADSMNFSYVFGSDEYPEFVGSFNDAFGFFISGPGISGTFTNGAINIALIPGTTDFVSINNVNAGNDDMDCMNCEYYVINTTNPDPTGTQFDGFTLPLNAAIGGLTIGESYHIKLAIGDALDTAFDSAVFLKDSSFELICTEEDGDNLIGGGLPCSLCTVDFDISSEVCGEVTLTNISDILIPYNASEFTFMGETYDGEAGPVDFDNVPPGEYEVQLTIYAGEYQSVVSDTFVLGYQTEFPYASLDSQESNETCVGTAEINMVEGNETFLFSWNDADYTTSNMEADLCPGMHTVKAWSESLCLLGEFDFEVEDSSIRVDEEHQGNGASINFFPNPTGDVITLVTDGQFEQVEVININGKVVAKTRVAASESTTTLDLSNLSQGVYWVRYGDATQKLIKK